MPFAEGGVIEARSLAARRIIDVPAHPLHTTFRELASAAANEVNVTLNALKFLDRERNFEVQVGYSPYEDQDIKPWVDLYPEDFETVVSKKHSLSVVKRLEERKERQRILAESGGTGLMLQLAAGIADPATMLIPVGWIGKAAGAAKTTLAARAALSAKYGVVASDDAVRIGVKLTDAELRLVQTGVKETMRDKGLGAALAVGRARSAERAAIEADTAAVAAIEERSARRLGTLEGEAQAATVAEAEGEALARIGARARESRVVATEEVLEAAKSGRLTVEQAESLGITLTATERRALGRPTVPAGSIEEARLAAAAARAEMRAAGFKVGAEEKDLHKKLIDFRSKGPTKKDLVEHYEQVDIELAVSGRATSQGPPPKSFSREELMIRFERDRQEALLAGRPLPVVFKERQILERLRAIQAARRDPSAELPFSPVVRVGDKALSVPTAERLARAQRAAARKAILTARGILESEAARKAALGDFRGAQKAAHDARVAAISHSQQVVAENIAAHKAALELRNVERVRDTARFQQAVEAGAERGVEAVKGRQAAIAAKVEASQAARTAAKQEALKGLPNGFEPMGRLAAEGALVGATVGGVSEVFLQAVQEGRERELIEHSFLAGGILGGILGGFGGLAVAIGQRRLNHIHTAMVEELTAGNPLDRLVDDELLSVEQVRAFMKASKLPDDVPRGTSAGGKLTPEARADAVADSVIERVKARSPSTGKMLESQKSYVRRAMRQLVLSPAGRSSYSSSATLSELAHILFPLPYLKGRQPLGPAVAMRIEDHTKVALGIEYRMEKIRGKLDRTEFYENVASYMTTGDKTKFAPEVMKAADEWRAYHREMLAALKKEGLLDEVDLGVDTDYFTRVFNFDRIQNDEAGWIAAVSPFVGREAAQRIREEILTNGPMALSIDRFFLTGATGSLRARELLNVPTSALLKFLHTDPRVVLRRYAHQVGAQLEVSRIQKTGTVTDRLNLTEWKQRIDEDFKAMLAEAKTDKQKKSILKEWQDAKTDIEFMRQSLLGFLERDPFNSAGRSITDVLTTSSSVMFLSNAGINSLGDTMGPAFVNGMRPWVRNAIARIRRTLEGIPKDELARESFLFQFTGAEHSRSGMFFDFMADADNAPKGHGGIWRNVHDSWMMINLLRPITAFASEQGTYTAIDELLRASRKLANGQALNRAERNNLILSGLDDATASKIGRKVNEGGAKEVKGAYLADLNAWNDPELATTFRAAVAQNLHRGVLNAKRGELPMVMRGHLGRLLFQFYQYPISSTQNFLISGVQRADAAVAGGAAMMFGMGVFITVLNHYVRDGEIPPINDVIAESFDRSGLFGYFSNFNHYLSRATGGVADMNNMLGATTIADRYGPLDAGQVVPGFAAFAKMGKILRDGYRLVNGEEFTDEEARIATRRIPPLNALHFAPIQRAMESVVSSD